MALCHIGIIGLGMGARLHAGALKNLTHKLSVEAVYSRDSTRRGAFAREFGFPEVGSVKEMVDDPAIDAVLLLTPPNAREEFVELLSSAGKHILMEKPVERTTGAAQSLVQTCYQRGVTLGIVLQQRFSTGAQALKKKIDAGEFGPLALARVTVPWWRDQAYYDEPGRGTLLRDGGGVLLNQAIHTLDLLSWLAGPIADVQAVAATSALHRMETEDFVAAGIHFQNGAVGSICVTTAAFPGGPEEIWLHFEGASTRLSGGALEISWRSGKEERIGTASATGGGANPIAFASDWHSALIDDFVTAVQKNSRPAITGEDALPVHRLIEALLQSAHEGRAINVPAVGGV